MVKIKDLKPGTRVEYHGVGGSAQTTLGHVKKILTHDEVAGSTQVNIHADDKHPRMLIELSGELITGILVENDHTKKETAYKLENIVRIASEDEKFEVHAAQGHGNISIDKLKPGMKVEYMPIGASTQTTVGKIQKILTHDEVAGSTQKHFKADEEHPRIYPL
jgi:hypothetical protein